MNLELKKLVDNNHVDHKTLNSYKFLMKNVSNNHNYHKIFVNLLDFRNFKVIFNNGKLGLIRSLKITDYTHPQMYDVFDIIYNPKPYRMITCTSKKELFLFLRKNISEICFTSKHIMSKKRMWEIVDIFVKNGLNGVKAKFNYCSSFSYSASADKTHFEKAPITESEVYIMLILKYFVEKINEILGIVAPKRVL